MTPDRREFLALGVGLLGIAALPRILRRDPALVRARIPVMGTVAEVVVRHPDEAWAHRGARAAFAELRRVEAAMTRFRSDSDVGRINARAGQAAVRVHPDTHHVLEAAFSWAEASGGRFDPCLGAASELWDVGKRTSPPDRRERDRFADRRLWTALSLQSTEETPLAGLTGRDARLDLGGIAKGFGVDAAAQALRDLGILHGLVNVGGDLVALGVAEDGEPWRVGVRSPWDSSQVVHELRVSDRAIATSGDYMNYFRHDGRIYPHLIDPLTGEPRLGSMRSLTVEADRCMTADAAATALFGADPHTTATILAHAPEAIVITHQIQESTS